MKISRKDVPLLIAYAVLTAVFGVGALIFAVAMGA